jgi:hypothetical protein
MRLDQRLGVRLIAEELNMNTETVRQIITDDSGMKKIFAKMVIDFLTDDQEERRLHISSDLLYNAEMFDETLCFQYDPETKRQSMQWKTQNSPRPKKARMSRSQFSTMLLCFSDHNSL